MVIDFNSIASGKKLYASHRKQDMSSGKLLQLRNHRPVFARQTGKLRGTLFLTGSKEDMITNLNSMLLSLSPDQFALVFKKIRTMIDELCDVNE